ncbi:MAG: rane protein [Paenibacillus sp.]|nr:rane protein [Paenibacillus sp.]
MKEKKAGYLNGYIGILLLLCVIALTVYAFAMESVGIGIALVVVDVLLLSSITVIQPNQSNVLTFFGKYAGTVREGGMWLVVPLTNRRKVSLRVRNFNSAKLKVNDIDGSPIEIAAVIVFRVVDTAKAVFDVENYEQFVEIQSETALRHVASKYPYDNLNSTGYSLRSNAEEIAAELTLELQSRLSVAGVEVVEARLTHLAYSTEIASAMLQRQQASAIISAREMIVDGAVSMVQAAISRLERDGVQLDDERKAAMINNLMVAIVSERSAQPIVNAGSIY